MILLGSFHGFHLLKHDHALAVRIQIPRRPAESDNPYPRLRGHERVAFDRVIDRHDLVARTVKQLVSDPGPTCTRSTAVRYLPLSAFYRRRKRANVYFIRSRFV